MNQRASYDIFIAYSREDEKYRLLLEKHLNILQRQALIKTWHDGKIEPGIDWEAEIETNLNSSDIIILLISIDFLSSDYCYNNEMSKALERHKSGDSKVIPIITRPCDWEDSPFAKLQVLPDKGKPISTWGNDLDTPMNNIAKSIKDIIKTTKEQKEAHVRKLSVEIKKLEEEKDALLKEVKNLNKNKASQLSYLENLLTINKVVDDEFVKKYKTHLDEKIKNLEISHQIYTDMNKNHQLQIAESIEIISENGGIDLIKNEIVNYIDKLKAIRENINKANDVEIDFVNKKNELSSRNLEPETLNKNLIYTQYSINSFFIKTFEQFIPRRTIFVIEVHPQREEIGEFCLVDDFDTLQFAFNIPDTLLPSNTCEIRNSGGPPGQTH